MQGFQHTRATRWANLPRFEFYAVLFNRRPVTARTPLRFATAHRFFAASEILFRPSALRPCRDSVDLAGGFSRLGPRACL